MRDDDEPAFATRLLRDQGGELAVAAVYALAWLFGAFLPDRVLLPLVIAVGLQFFFVTMALGAITPRGRGPIIACVVGHALLFALLAFVASAGGKQRPDWLAIVLVQAPLVVHNVQRLFHRGAGWLLEAIGPFALAMPVVVVAAVLHALLPDPGLAARTIRFERLAPLAGKDIAFALLAGATYFALGAVARTWLGRVEEHRRAELDPATIERWKQQYERSRKN